MGWLSLIFGLFKGPLARVLDTVDKKTEAGMNQDTLKAEIIKTHYATRAGFMQAGGFWLMLLFAAPLAFWFAAVCVYSVFWCAGCAYPQTWTVAALPAPLDQWSGAIITAIFGVVGLTRFARR